MPSSSTKIVHVIQDEDSDNSVTQVTRRARSSMQSSSNVAKATAKANRKCQRRMMRNFLAGSRKARRTPKAREGIVSGTDLPIPLALVRLRQSTLYQKLIPASICREELDREIEKQIVEEGLEDEDLVETWTMFYEDALYSKVLSDEGFGADDV